MDKKITQTDLENTINTLADGFQRSFEEGDEYAFLSQYFDGEVKNFEDYNLLKILPIKQTLHAKFKQYGKLMYKLTDLVMNYGFFDNTLSELIKKKEGWACSVDKSRWLIRQWVKWMLEGEMPDMTIGEKCYWKPHFGSAQQWIDFMEGLSFLLYGRPEKYIIALDALTRED